jgi:PAS domain S-box-containing protein
MDPARSDNVSPTEREQTLVSSRELGAIGVAVSQPSGEHAALVQRLAEAEETLHAIRTGAVDAFLIEEQQGERVYTLHGADRPYRFFVESMQQGALMLAPDGTVLFANGRMAELLGVPPGSLGGVMLARFVATEERAALAALLRSGSSAGTHAELHLQRSDGTSVPVYLTVSPLTTDTQPPVFLCAIVTDLSQQKQFEQVLRAQQALRESEERYRALFEQSAVAMAELDLATHRFLRANPAFCSLLGCTPERLAGLPHREVVHEAEREENCEALAATIERGQPVYRAERRYIRSDRTPIVVDLTISILRHADGRPMMGVEAVVDVTQRRHAEELLRDTDRRKDEFLATLAHELRNPLAPMRNALRILEHQMPSDGRVQWAQAVVRRQIQQMTRLVDDLMDLSRITRGQVMLRRSRVDLATVIRSAVETSQPVIEDRSHQLEVDLPREPITLDGDAARLTQVFSNLLNNAALYTDPGGHISITVSPETSHVRVAVRDNGAGITEDVLPHIFDMFSQGNGRAGPERTSTGLGIGLGLVKRLVEMHEGTVDAVSEGAGRGSTFIVRLPCIARAEPIGAPPPALPVAGDASRRFLVVDDNRDSTDSLQVLLTLLGHEARTAYDGATALRIGPEFKPEVVLLDLGMPHLSGYDTCRMLRETPWGKKALVIAVSGWGQEADRRRTREVGFDDHLVKPVDPEALMACVTRLIEARSAAA